MDFNPLDLLAAAAALQRDDPKKAKKSGGKNQSEVNCDEINTDEATEEDDSNKSDKMGSARKVRSEIKRQNSCNLPSDVGKLFGERSGSVDTVNEEELPGRTLRRHSWSAEGGTLNRDSACDSHLIIKDIGDDPEDSKNVSVDAESLEAKHDSNPPETIPDVQTKPHDSSLVDKEHHDSQESESEKCVQEYKQITPSVETPVVSDEPAVGVKDEADKNIDSNEKSCCPVCRAEIVTDQALTENSLCSVCGSTMSTEDAAVNSEVQDSGIEDAAVDFTNSDKSEASFIAMVDERTCSEVSEPVENHGSSCLLESYLTSVQKPGLSEDTNECEEGAGFSGSSPASSVVFDHSYASQPGRDMERSSTDYFDTENGAESDSCGENSSTEEVEHRARSMSMESACLRFGFDEKQISAKGHEDSDHMSTEASLMSPTSSVDSSLTDYPPLKLTTLSLPDKISDSSAHQQMLLQGYGSSDGCDDRLASPTSSVDSVQGQIPSKVGKFKIGTFASFSSSNIKSDTGLRNGSKTIRFKDHSTISAPFFDKGIMGSPPSVPQSPGIPSFLQSPCGDWDRSDAGSEVQDELGPPHCGETYSSAGSQESSEVSFTDNSSVHHDHDYCLREGVLPKDYGLDANVGKTERRKYSSWAKAKSGMVRHIKEPKVKSKARVKKIKLEVPESPPVTTPLEEVADFKQPFEVDMSQDRATSVIGRTSRRRLEKLEKLQEQLELDNGSKLKITGKFKDDYVYYLNKSSRSRRRASTDLPPPPPTDKIILPAPKPGDIIVPHLTDADIEAIKRRGKSGLSISEKYYGAGLSSALHSGNNLPAVDSQAQLPAHGSESMADMDSKIINTILSMESDSLGSPASVQESSMSDTVELYSPSDETVGISFMGENMTLTQDQVNLLLDAVRDVETSPEEIIDSTKYSLDNNQNYDQPVEHLEITTSDQQSLDGGSTADETERRQSVSSAASEMETEHKDCPETNDHEDAVIESQSCLVKASESLPITSSASVPVSASAAVVVPPTVNPNESPVKALLEADLQTIGDSTPLRDLIPTLEKPFDLLENDFRLDKSDLFPEASVMDHTAPCLQTPTTSAASSATSTASDYNTPWIVTVTMFWNDLPAIMIDNQPFVRLVDIHKQILPAKDTGILKKRCQLLGIEVLNCSEMQRYFLVQYGRAYNSKSTLIVSKDDAKNLIGYYVNPQPRVAKLEDCRKEDPELSSDSSVASQQSTENHPVKITTPTVPKKKMKPKGQPKVSAVVKTEFLPAAVPVALKDSEATPQPVEAIQPDQQAPQPQVSKRLRHKKINFLELLKGEVNNETNSIVEHVEEKKLDKEDEELNRKTTSSPSSPNSRKKTKLSDAEKLKLVREELKKRRIELPDDSSPEKKIPRVVEQDSEEENHSSPTRRRFPGSRPRGANPINGNRRSRLKKVGPLKVKIKGLLHFKKGKKKTASDVDNKVIEIRHKDPKPTNSHPSVTQDGDIHLDLYQKKSSLCIKCCSCKKFFSLRNFLTHQHYPDDTEVLTTVAQPQILEPRTTKLSEKKKTLWQEFNKRRKQLEGSKPVSEPKPIVLSKPLNIVNKSVIPTSPAPVPAKTDILNSSLPEDIPVYKPGSALEAELRKKTEIPRFKQPVTTVAVSSRRKPSSSGVRVSSRKRKERQLFPIENYSFTKKTARLDMPLNGEVVMEVDEAAQASGASAGKAAAAAVASNCVLTLSNGPELTQYTALQDAPEL